jgi:hypothetical protein
MKTIHLFFTIPTLLAAGISDWMLDDRHEVT